MTTIDLRNQPVLLNSALRERLLDSLMPMFRDALPATGKPFPGRDAILAEYASGHDVEILEMARDLSPEPAVQDFAARRLANARRPGR